MIYEYKCESCGNIQEQWQKMSDPAPEECNVCHSLGKLERIISATSFALKGTGWYTTDYKKSAQAKEASDPLLAAPVSPSKDVSSGQPPAAVSPPPAPSAVGGPVSKANANGTGAQV